MLSLSEMCFPYRAPKWLRHKKFVLYISPIEISENWSGSLQLWTRPIYTVFNRANLVFMRSYLDQRIHVKFGVWGFLSCSTEIWSPKCSNAKTKNDATLRYSKIKRRMDYLVKTTSVFAYTTVWRKHCKPVVNIFH